MGSVAGSTGTPAITGVASSAETRHEGQGERVASSRSLPGACGPISAFECTQCAAERTTVTFNTEQQS